MLRLKRNSKTKKTTKLSEANVNKLKSECETVENANENNKYKLS